MNCSRRDEGEAATSDRSFDERENRIRPSKIYTKIGLGWVAPARQIMLNIHLVYFMRAIFCRTVLALRVAKHEYG